MTAARPCGRVLIPTEVLAGYRLGGDTSQKVLDASLTKPRMLKSGK